MPKTDNKTLLKQIHPQGTLWKDATGDPLNAHGSGFLKVDDTYYLYGEFKQGETRKLEHITHWEAYYIDAIGLSCYSSKDLANWNYEGLALSASGPNLSAESIMERPKVLYNKASQQYVMWFHLDNREYTRAEVGIATSSSPKGPFTFIRGFRPNGNDSRDMTLFQDDDGSAYLFYSSEMNATMHICRLTPDYLNCETEERRVFQDEKREAPSVFKYQNKYYMVTSGCTGWDPNPSLLSVADDIFGDWTHLGDICKDDEKGTTFDSQCNYVLPIKPEQGAFILCADRWNKLDLEKSGYVWLPFQMNGSNAPVQWKDSYQSPLKITPNDSNA